MGLRTAEPSDTADSAYWHETKAPELLHPQNIYLAQLEKLGKLSIHHRLKPGGATALEGRRIVSGLTERTTYAIYLRSGSLTGPPGSWTNATSFTTNPSARGN